MGVHFKDVVPTNSGRAEVVKARQTSEKQAEGEGQRRGDKTQPGRNEFSVATEAIAEQGSREMIFGQCKMPNLRKETIPGR